MRRLPPCSAYPHALPTRMPRLPACRAYIPLPRILIPYSPSPIPHSSFPISPSNYGPATIIDTLPLAAAVIPPSDEMAAETTYSPPSLGAVQT